MTRDWVLSVRMISPGHGTALLFVAAGEALTFTTEPRCALRFESQLQCHYWIAGHVDEIVGLGVKPMEIEEEPPPIRKVA